MDNRNNGHAAQPPHLSQRGMNNPEEHPRMRHHTRPLTVVEAIPYSPFSSVVPFNSAIVPSPGIGLQSPVTLFSSPVEQHEARKGLEAINNTHQTGISSHEDLQRFIKDAQDLLQPHMLTSYKFQMTAPILSAPSGTGYKMSLSRAAQAVFDNTKVPHSLSATIATTPFSGLDVEPMPASRIKPANRNAKKSPSTPPVLQHHKSLNGHAHAHNNNISSTTSNSNGTTAPRVSSQSTQSILTPPIIKPAAYVNSNGKSNVAIVLPKQIINKDQYSTIPSEDTPAKMAQADYINSSITVAVPRVILPQISDGFRKADYVVCPGDDLPSPAKNKFDDIPAVYRDSDKQTKSDEVLQSLRKYLSDVFEAEDEFQPGSIAHNEFLFENDGIPFLTNDAHTTVESQISKVVKHGQLARIPLDELMRIQKLCEPCIRNAQSIDVKLDTDHNWEEIEVDNWIARLSEMETGLRAARTALRIMMGDREERQLYSEEIIQMSLDVLKNVCENAIMPVVELRAAGTTANLQKLLFERRKQLASILPHCRRLTLLLTELVGKIELSETVVNTLEYLVSQLIFVENAKSDRDDIMGIQRFDALRVAAMDALAQIFSSHPAQRQGIFDDILTSLERLPATKQSARHFRLAEGGSIQLVSALLMRLVQSTACHSVIDEKEQARSPDVSMNDGGSADGHVKIDSASSRVPLNPDDTENRAANDPLTAIQALQRKATTLSDKAKHNAQYVVSFMVNRAMGTSKTGDSPYRNLLDLFIQDFITCLGSSDWPAAELLLRYVLYKMISLAENERTPSLAKNMALETLAEMGAAIAQMVSQTRAMVSTLRASGGANALETHVISVSEAFLDAKIVSPDLLHQLIAWNGLYHISTEELCKRSSNDRALQSAVGFRAVDWALQTISSYDDLGDDEPKNVEQEHGRSAYKIRMMILDRDWLSNEGQFNSVAPTYARLAYATTILTSEFCKSFERILMNLLNAMSSEQATVRSKSLKSVDQVLETDPSILDRMNSVVKLIIRCLSDNSVQVRDSALGLLSKCITLRPALEEQAIPDILGRVSDTGTNVRKRAIRLLKEIYLRTKKEDVKAAIAEILLQRVNDFDEGVQEFAMTTIEEIWMIPFHTSGDTDDASTHYKLKVAAHVRLMARTINKSTGASAVLDKVLNNMLAVQSKLATPNRRVCKTLVATMFEAVVDNSVPGIERRLDYHDSLQLLMIFAKAEPLLFTADQIQLLEPYSLNLKTKEDLVIFRAVVVVWRHVFPQLSMVHAKFLQRVRGTLLSSIQKLSKNLMDDVIACLWIISGALSDKKNIATLTRSALAGVHKMKAIDFRGTNNANVARLSKLALIVGLVGKHCDLDDEAVFFKEAFSTMKGSSIAKLIVDIVIPFTSPSQPMDVRLACLDAVGMVCQSWPRNFSSVNVFTSLQLALDEQNPQLDGVVLGSFNEFLKLEEKRAEPATDIPVGANIEIKATLGVMGGTAHDGVSLEIAQKFLEHITRIALASQDELALLATEILCSINRQGLNHPKECGPALVALETSQNKTIADMAYTEHRALHEKHETIMEKEYMRAVLAAYTYQRDVVKDTRGAWKDTSVSKLSSLVDVLKISKPRSRKRFFESLCARADFDLNKLDASGTMPAHVEFSRFIAENLAFFDYATIDDLLASIAAVESLVASTGSAVMHAIDTQLHSITMDEQPKSQVQEDAVSGAADIKMTVESDIDIHRLRQLTAASMILASLWHARTYLRRTYGLMHNPKKEAKSKVKDKDTNKLPVRVPFSTTDKVWADFDELANGLSSEINMRAQCKSFVDMMAIDQEFRLTAETGDADESARQRYRTPDEDDEVSVATTPGGRKRKGSTTPSGRKKKIRASSLSRGRKKRALSNSDDDDSGFE